MKFNEIRPYVLNVTPRRYMSDQKKSGQMLHWVILYIDAGQGEIRLNNRRAEPLGTGSAVMFQPGTSYSLRVTGDEMTGSMIEFDLAPEMTCEQAAALRIDDMPRLNEPFVVSDVAALKASMDEALTIFMRHEPMWEMSVAARCVEAITVMARATNSRMHYLVNQVITLISERYNQAVGNSDIARELGKHPNYINAVFVRDMGMSLQMTNFEENGKRRNANNAKFDYAVAGLRLAKKLGLSFGLVPFTQIGYNFSTLSTIGTSQSKLEYAKTYQGSGGLRQVYLGLGYEPIKNLSIGVNAAYVWGEYSHILANTYSDIRVVRDLAYLDRVIIATRR